MATNVTIAALNTTTANAASQKSMKWQNLNPDRYQAYHREYQKSRRANDLEYLEKERAYNRKYYHAKRKARLLALNGKVIEGETTRTPNHNHATDSTDREQFP